MTQFQARVTTGNGSRYLQQLCKHWSHKFEVAFDPTHGVVHLPGADAIFDADAQGLSLIVEGEAEEDLPRLCEVVTNHLNRFAFREPFEVRWEKRPA